MIAEEYLQHDGHRFSLDELRQTFGEFIAQDAYRASWWLGEKKDLTFTFKIEPLEIFAPDIALLKKYLLEHDSYGDDPKGEHRTRMNNIVDLLNDDGNQYPIFVLKDHDPRWLPDNRTFEVIDEGKHRALAYDVFALETVPVVYYDTTA